MHAWQLNKKKKKIEEHGFLNLDLQGDVSRMRIEMFESERGWLLILLGHWIGEDMYLNRSRLKH